MPFVLALFSHLAKGLIILLQLPRPRYLTCPALCMPYNHGSTGGSDDDNLMRGRQVTPSGMVPPPLEEDVISSPPYIFYILKFYVPVGWLVGLSGFHSPTGRRIRTVYMSKEPSGPRN